METTKEHQIEVLNDLVKINLDRVQGYEKAIEDSKEFTTLIPTFREMQNQSERNLLELRSKVGQLGGEPANDKTLPGKIYHMWMDIKSAFSNKEKSILDLCEFGEDAALKAYEMALKSENGLTPETYGIISQQKSGIRKSHDTIKGMRDGAKTSN